MLHSVPSISYDFGHRMTRGRPGSEEVPPYTRPMARLRLGLLGGTFDPPHVGHLAAAVEARAVLALDRVLLVVANDPWQKSSVRRISPAGDRLAMTEAACLGLEGIEASALEIERGGPSYMVDTLGQLSGPDVDLFLILGVDAAAGLSTWERWAELPGLATLVIVERAGDVAPSVDPTWKVEHVPLIRLDISSSDLRCRASEGRPLRPYVPEPVIDVIEGRSLYGADRS